MRVKLLLFLLLFCAGVHASEQKDGKEKGPKEKAVKGKIEKEVVLPAEVLMSVMTGNIENLIKTFDEHPEYINAKMDKRDSPLRMVIFYSRFRSNLNYDDVIKLLLERGAEINEAIDIELSSGPGIVLQYLLNHNVIGINDKDETGYTLLHRAIKYLNPKAVGYLLARDADTKEKNPENFDALEYVLYVKNEELKMQKFFGPDRFVSDIQKYDEIIKLLQTHKIPDYSKHAFSITKSELAEFDPTLLCENMGELLGQYIVNPYQKLINLNTEERKICKEIELIEQALEKMPQNQSDFKKLSEDQQQAILKHTNKLAALNARLENIVNEKKLIQINFVKKAIIENNINRLILHVKEDPYLLTLKDETGNTILDFARLWGRKEIIALLENINAKYQGKLLEELQTYKKKDVDLIKQSFFEAIVANNQDILLDYIRKGGDVNIVNLQRETPLMFIAYYKDDPFLIHLLLQNKANPFMRDDFRDTALHHAARGGNAFVVEELLKYAPDLVTMENCAGYTAYDYAKSRYDMRVKKMKEAEKKVKAKLSEKEMKLILQRYQDKLLAYQKILDLLQSYAEKVKKKEKE